MKKLFERLKNSGPRARGIALTFVLSLSLLIYFFGPVLSSPNEYYFDQSGDGLLTYYSATYQLKYDSTYWHIGASNYPYGESVFFSSDQPVLTAALRFINNNLFTISDHIPGIFNSLMLYSFCICAVFIFLVLYELEVNYLYAVFFAIGIAFLSPQWIRLQAHFPLSYAFAIPGIFYLLLRFQRAPSFKKSFQIAAFVFLMAALHAYFLGLFGIIFVIYFLFNAFKGPGRLRNFLRHGIYFIIQLVLPFLVLQFLINSSTNVTDRTSYPWGFLYYVSSFDGMFFPYGKPYQALLGKHYIPENVEQFEGLAYNGIFAIIVSLLFLVRKINQLSEFRFREFISTGMNARILFLLLAGIAGALYACGIPYIYYDNLMHYVGPLRQMRGLGRFAWLLFYSLNIFAAWFFYKAVIRTQKKWAKVVICLAPLSFLYWDAYYTVLPVSQSIANKIPVINDRSNQLPENKWVNEIDIKKYQAILPLPYFLLGSENLGFEPEKREIFKQTYIASLKTGLPIVSAVLSRTSLSQTRKHVSLMYEPYRPLEIVKDLPSKKPLLVLARENDITEFMQKDLLAKTTLIKTTPAFNLYELKYETLGGYSDSLYSVINREAALFTLTDHNGWLSTQNVKNFVYKSFDETPGEVNYRGKGSFTGKVKDYNRLFEDTLPNVVEGQSYILSFWVAGLTHDLYPRTTIELAWQDSATAQGYGGWWSALGSHVRTLDSSWALVEIYLKPTHKHDKLLVTIWNNNFIHDEKIVIDELWLRPEFTHIYRRFPNEIFKNNRYYLKR